MARSLRTGSGRKQPARRSPESPLDRSTVISAPQGRLRGWWNEPERKRPRRIAVIVVAVFVALFVIGSVMEDTTADRPAGSTPAESTDPYVEAGALFIRECGSYYNSGDMAGFNDCIDRVTEEYGP